MKQVRQLAIEVIMYKKLTIIDQSTALKQNIGLHLTASYKGSQKWLV